MREPYRTFFDGYEDHWMLGRYLQGSEPDWYGIAFDERLDDLSKGEKVLVDFAAAFANVFVHLDERHQANVVNGLVQALGAY